jgi:peptide/nickel transport system substrate-binding protein
VIVRSFRNQDVMYMALRKGEIDMPYLYAAGTPPSHVPPLLRDPDIRIHRLNNPGVPRAIFFNTQKPPVDQPDFRRALALAIDYEEIIRFFAAGYGSVPNGGFVPRGTPGFVETAPLSHDPEQAKKLLQGLGYVDTDHDGFLERNGTVAELKLVLRTDVAGALRLSELLKEYFENIGVKLTLRPVDLAMFLTVCDQERSQMAVLSRTTPWGMMMWAGFGSGYMDSRNIGWSLLSDPRFTGIVDRMCGTLDRDDYLQGAAGLQHYYAGALPAVPLYWDDLIQPCHRRFQGWKNSPMYGLLWEGSWFNLLEVSP